MLLDGAQLPHGSSLRAEVAVVGAGPAGIVTALELAQNGIDVVLVESGTERFDPSTQGLSDLGEHDQHHHAPMSISSRRQLGGASVIWGGRCVPYDPIDFVPRPVSGYVGWPVDHDEFVGYYQRASDWFFSGDAVFDARDIPELATRALVPGFPDGGAVQATTLERWSLPTNFWREHGKRLRESTLARVVTGFTCVRVETDEDGGEVTRLILRALDGRHAELTARQYVIACGGLETTRLLLCSSSAAHPSGIGDHSGHLGHWYMSHISGRIARVEFSTAPDKTVYGHERDRAGVYVRRRLSFSKALLEERDLPNHIAWLVNPDLPDAGHGSPVLSFAYLALTSPIGGQFAPEAIRQSLTKGTQSPKADHIRNVADGWREATSFALRFGYGRFLKRRRTPGFFIHSQANTYPLHYHGEHLPHYGSRVWLTDQRDELGQRRLGIDLRFTEADIDGIVRAHRYWDEYLQEQQLGRLNYLVDDLEAAVWNQTEGGYHQVGLTRMSSSPDDGVVDRNLAVHGVRNLYVASSSAFPTSGQANSTFMIVACAVRLADHLRAEMRAPAVSAGP